MSMRGDTMILSDGMKLPYLTKNKKHYLNFTTFLYGATGTGKTTIIKEIMYLLKDDMPNIFVVSPSNESNDAFTGIIPPRCIRSNITKKWIEALWARQKEVTQLYNCVHELEGLRRIFDKITNNKFIKFEKRLIHETNCAKAKIVRGYVSRTAKEIQLNDLVKQKNIALVELYRNAIRANKNKSFSNFTCLTKIEKNLVNYLDINPNLLLIFDDATEYFKDWMKMFGKGDNNIFKSMLYRGRHQKITLIICAHDDKEIDSGLRKNSRVSIFTTSQSAIAHFDRKANAYSPKEKKAVNKIAAELYATTDKLRYEKLAYVREDPNKFQYCLASLWPSFKLGSSSLWKLNKKLPNSTDGKIDENKFLMDF